MAYSITYRAIWFLIVVCILLGLTWSVLPLLGWSHYSFEGSHTSCSVEWNDKSLNVVSYNITMFGFVYLIPLVAIIITNVKLIIMLKNLKNLLKKSNKVLQKKILFERRMTILMIFLMGSFLLSWSPYAIVSMYAAFVDRVEAMTSTLPSLFAKSSMLWTSVFYILSNKKVRNDLSFEMFFLYKRQSDSNMSKTSGKYFFIAYISLVLIYFV